MGVIFLIFMGCLATGTMNNIRAIHASEMCSRQKISNAIPEYNFFIVLMAGLAVIVAFIAAMLGKYPIAVGALVVSILIPGAYIMDAIKMVPLMKEAGWDSSAMLHFQPWWIWARIVLLGMGKWTHVFLYVTLIGIPLYNAMEHGLNTLDDLTEQIELRNEYEKLRK